MEEWARIFEYPRYSVSTHGRVKINDNDRVLTLFRNQKGIVYVSLFKSAVRTNRAVGLLVARTFIDKPQLDYRTDFFESIVNLNGDRSNNRVDNLMWRPLWFARSFHQQFEDTSSWDALVQECSSNKRYTIKEVVTKYGVLGKDVIRTSMNNLGEQNTQMRVWPTRKAFRYIG